MDDLIDLQSYLKPAVELARGDSDRDRKERRRTGTKKLELLGNQVIKFLFATDLDSMMFPDKDDYIKRQQGGP